MANLRWTGVFDHLTIHGSISLTNLVLALAFGYFNVKLHVFARAIVGNEEEGLEIPKIEIKLDRADLSSDRSCQKALHPSNMFRNVDLVACNVSPY